MEKTKIKWKAEILNTYQYTGAEEKYVVNFRKWEDGKCACKATKDSLIFTQETTQAELINFLNK